jgi:hypothetical protein
MSINIANPMTLLTRKNKAGRTKWMRWRSLVRIVWLRLKAQTMEAERRKTRNLRGVEEVKSAKSSYTFVPSLVRFASLFIR